MTVERLVGWASLNLEIYMSLLYTPSQSKQTIFRTRKTIKIKTRWKTTLLSRYQLIQAYCTTRSSCAIVLHTKQSLTTSVCVDHVAQDQTSYTQHGHSHNRPSQVRIEQCQYQIASELRWLQLQYMYHYFVKLQLINWKLYIVS